MIEHIHVVCCVLLLGQGLIQDFELLLEGDIEHVSAHLYLVFSITVHLKLLGRGKKPQGCGNPYMYDTHALNKSLLGMFTDYIITV